MKQNFINSIKIIISTFPDEKTAHKIANHLVKKHLAACVNVLGGNITSFYNWRGKLHKDNETLAIIKCKTANYQQVEQEICKLHPYEVPEIISIQPTNCSKPYLEWLLK